MDQLVSADSNHLLTWNEVKYQNNNNFKGPKPKWFKLLEDSYTISNYRTLTYLLINTYIIPKRLQQVPHKLIGRQKKLTEWTYHWHTPTQSCIIGKSRLQDTALHSSITIMEHYVPLDTSTNNITLTNNMFNTTPLCLTPCPGCRLNILT
ncbi:hypothetical protein C1646_776793 [Rhizophagus diaphanus]|nr:hypothetical protein C1646_776793 [Rhizophagus diaphanus] [Rhizophagus sp. MUCL 43196]